MIPNKLLTFKILDATVMLNKLYFFIELGRWHKPIGIILLMLPCWWGVALATPTSQLPSPFLLLVFAWGAFWLRSAGCTYNDIIDRHIDRQVSRTKQRPIAAGHITVSQGYYFLAVQMILGSLALYWLSIPAIIISLSALVLVFMYPFMKRFTWWPQAFLGFTFNIGVLVGYSTVTNEISVASLLLYACGICWTIIYDTLYAHQDREDDALIGVKSTARLFGHLTKPVLYLFAGMQVVLLIYVMITSAINMSITSITAIILTSALLFINIHKCDINKPLSCLNAFRFHRWIGLMIFVTLMISKYSLNT